MRADWEVSLENFTPVLPSKKPAASPAAAPDRVSGGSPGQGSLRSERQPAALPGTGSDREDSAEEAEPVPTPLSEIPFEGAHVIEFSELTSGNSRIQLENFLEDFRGESQLAPLVRCFLQISKMLISTTDCTKTAVEDINISGACVSYHVPPVTSIRSMTCSDGDAQTCSSFAGGSMRTTQLRYLPTLRLRNRR